MNYRFTWIVFFHNFIVELSKWPIETQNGGHLTWKGHLKLPKHLTRKNLEHFVSNDFHNPKLNSPKNPDVYISIWNRFGESQLYVYICPISDPIETYGSELVFHRNLLLFFGGKAGFGGWIFAVFSFTKQASTTKTSGSTGWWGSCPDPIVATPGCLQKTNTMGSLVYIADPDLWSM